MYVIKEMKKKINKVGRKNTKLKEMRKRERMKQNKKQEGK
jgi:hypothetical protein